MPEITTILYIAVLFVNINYLDYKNTGYKGSKYLAVFWSIMSCLIAFVGLSAL